MNRSHVTEALEAELVEPRQPDARAGDMAFATATVLALAAANSVLPLAGGVAAVCAGVAANHARQRYRDDARGRVEEAVDHEVACRVLPEAPVEWSQWLPWEELGAGREVDVPAGFDHPRDIGFRPTRLASYVGQRSDWVHPLGDGSRLHAHEWADGEVSLHRDRVDPARGPGTAAVHWLAETPEGNVAGAVLATVGIGTLAWMVGS
jgi:hypothetical protein